MIIPGEGETITYSFDYFIKDHLGNVRMVLTDEQKKEVAMATMETYLQPYETPLFYNVDNGNIVYPVNQVTGYPADNTTTPNQYVARVNLTNRVGPSRVIRVMSGDVVSANAKSYFTSVHTVALVLKERRAAEGNMIWKFGNESSKL